MDSCLHAKRPCSLTMISISVFLLSLLVTFTPADAYDPLDPNGNITIKWDIKQWTGDGYQATVTIFNYQQYRHIDEPGWRLGWAWAKKEVIWSMVGAQATEQGDCSKFKSTIPHCCLKKPTVVDLLPGTPYNQQTANCCKGGVLSSWAQDPVKAVASFEIAVGQAGTSNKTVQKPVNFTLLTPGPGYTCGSAKTVPPTKFFMPDGRRVTQALLTWNISCTYSQTRAQQRPTCCVSLSSFYNDTIVGCPVCSCGCQNSIAEPQSCVKPGSHPLSVGKKKDLTPLIQCTSHMCPIRVHWHIKVNYKEYWRAKVTVTNFNYGKNYSQWNVVAQHPNFNDLNKIFSFNYLSLSPYGTTNDTAILYGLPFYNDVLLQAGPTGNVQSELLFKKNKSTFTFREGWAFPRRIYFNGDNCVMPDPQTYPYMPNSSSRTIYSLLTTLASLLFLLVCVY